MKIRRILKCTYSNDLVVIMRAHFFTKQSVRS